MTFLQNLPKSGQALGNFRIGKAEYFPGYNEICDVMDMAKHSPSGLDAARRILTQLAYKALKVPEAHAQFKLYQLALKDIGEDFAHKHESRPLQERL